MKSLMLKFTLIIFATTMLFSCKDESLHEEVTLNIDAESRYALYESSADIENNKPIKSGLIGIKFLNCFNSAKRIYALGKTEKNYYFELHGSNGVKYYYDFRTTGERVVRLSRWLKKTKYGYEGSGANYSTECLIRNLE